MTDVTQILRDVEQGDPSAAEQLLPLVYTELRKLAAAKLNGEKAGQTLQATALVHEAYLRLVHGGGGDSPNWNNRGHFFAAAATAMRRILVDRARRKRALKQGGEFRRHDCNLDSLQASVADDRLLAIHEALERLERENPDIARLVTLRYFAGLTVDETAKALGISPRTAHRYWIYAKAWLRTAVVE